MPSGALIVCSYDPGPYLQLAALPHLVLGLTPLVFAWLSLKRWQISMSGILIVTAAVAVSLVCMGKGVRLMASIPPRVTLWFWGRFAVSEGAVFLASLGLGGALVRWRRRAEPK